MERRKSGFWKQNQASAEQVADAATAPVSAASDFVSRFNPTVSLVLQGTATNYQNDPDDWHLPGFQLGGETGRKPERLSLDDSVVIWTPATAGSWACHTYGATPRIASPVTAMATKKAAPASMATAT